MRKGKQGREKWDMVEDLCNDITTSEQRYMMHFF